jgi:hypothetical protein
MSSGMWALLAPQYKLGLLADKQMMAKDFVQSQNCECTGIHRSPQSFDELHGGITTDGNHLPTHGLPRATGRALH